MVKGTQSQKKSHLLKVLLQDNVKARKRTQPSASCSSIPQMCVLLASGHWIVVVKKWFLFPPIYSIKSCCWQDGMSEQCELLQNSLHVFQKMFRQPSNFSFCLSIFKLHMEVFVAVSQSSGLQKMYCHSLFTYFFIVCFPKERQLAVLSLSVSCNCCLSQITFKQLSDFILIWQKWKKKKICRKTRFQQIKKKILGQKERKDSISALAEGGTAG